MEKRCVSMWLGYFIPDFFLFLFVSSSLVCVIPSSAKWTFASGVKTILFSEWSVSSISSGAMNSVSQSAQYPMTQIFGLLRYHCQYENIFFLLLFVFQTCTHKLFTTTLEQYTFRWIRMLVKSQKLTFSIYINTNATQGLVTIEKLCVLFFLTKLIP